MHKDERVTIKDFADVYGVSYDTVYNAVKRLFPEILQHGKTTYLNELQIAVISRELKNNTSVIHHQTVEVSSTVANTTTELELQQNFYAASQAYAKYLETERARLQSENEHQKQQLIEQEPKVDFYNAVTSSADCIDMKTVAKTLNFEKIGRNKLFEILRNEKILDRSNRPYQKYVDAGFFRTIETSWTEPDGEQHINIKTVVFQKGLDFIKKVVSKAVKNRQEEFQPISE